MMEAFAKVSKQVFRELKDLKRKISKQILLWEEIFNKNSKLGDNSDNLVRKMKNIFFWFQNLENYYYTPVRALYFSLIVFWFFKKERWQN